MSRTRASVCRSLIELVADDAYGCVPIAGSGTTALDALLASVLQPRARILCVTAGRYGERIADAARGWGHAVTSLAAEPGQPFDARRLDDALAQGCFDWVSFVHGETSTGVLHPIEQMCAVAGRRGARVLLDIVGTLGTVDIQLAELGVDAAFASSAKGLEGPAGLGLALVRRGHLQRESVCPSITLDLPAQWRRFQADGQSRFTPPTASLRGLEAALGVLEEEGGVRRRRLRYESLAATVTAELEPIGQGCTVPAAHRMPLILPMRSETVPAATLIEQLRGKRIELYPAVGGDPQGYRLGLVGVRPDDVHALCVQMRAVSV